MNQNIYILTENEFLNDLLRKNRFSGKKNCFLDLNLNSSKINNVKDFKKLDRFFAYKNSNVFIKNYIDLFSKLSVKNHSRIWWCSEHVTRNRFTSDLPNILANYIEIVRATKKSSFDNFVFVVQDKQLGNTLKRLLINKDNFGLKIEKLFVLIKNFIASTYSVLIILYKYILSKAILNNSNFFSDKDCSYLIKSHFYNSSIKENGGYNDSFFPNISKYIGKKNKANFLVHIQDSYLKSIIKIKQIKNSIVLPYEYFLNLNDIVGGYLKIISNKNFVFDQTKFYGINVSHVLEREFYNTNTSLGHFLMYESTRNVIKRNKFRKTYLTYENIAWENMFIKAFLDFSPECEIIGFQHTVIPQAAMGMFLGKEEIRLKPLPNKIITTGDETKKIIQKYSFLDGYKISSSCALRFQWLHKRKLKKTSNKIKNILIALEGIPQAIELVDEVARQKRDLKKYKITIRTHKVMPWDKIKRYSSEKDDVFRHFIFSKQGELIKDILNSDLCIYWGSTVSLEAGYVGIPLLNFNNSVIASYDPLFDIKNLKWSFRKGDSIKKIIDKIDSINKAKMSVEKNKLRKYIKNYLSPITLKSLRELNS